MSASLPLVCERDIWREENPHHPRAVRVVSVRSESVFIHRVKWMDSIGWIKPKRAPTREVQRIRFDGRLYGYSLIDRPTSEASQL